MSATNILHAHSRTHTRVATDKKRSKSQHKFQRVQLWESGFVHLTNGRVLITVKTKSFHHLSNRRRIRTSISHSLTLWPHQTHITRIICNAILGQLIYFENKNEKQKKRKNLKQNRV